MLHVLRSKLAKEHKLEITNNAQREGDRDLRGSAKCLHLRGGKEKPIDDLYKFTIGLQWFSQELTQQDDT